MRARVMTVALGVMAWTAAMSAQQTSRPTELTSMDYIEIQQLAIRYAYGLDTAADNGYLYANVFSPDGEFIGRQTPFTKGRDALARVARSVRKGNSMFVRHFITNHEIHPTPEGAAGTVYLMVVDVEEGQPSSIYIGGRYEDVYVKTEEGWRIQRRDARNLGAPRITPRVTPGASK